MCIYFTRFWILYTPFFPLILFCKPLRYRLLNLFTSSALRPQIKPLLFCIKTDTMFQRICPLICGTWRKTLSSWETLARKIIPVETRVFFTRMHVRQSVKFTHTFISIIILSLFSQNQFCWQKSNCISYFHSFHSWIISN